MGLKTGQNAIDFNLPGVDGKNYSLDSFKGKKLVAVIFTCNHCPYAKAYQDRIISIQNDFSESLAIVAINPNDSDGYPEDDFEHMVTRAKEKNFNFPYVRDETQETARSYGAEVTPDIFLFDENRILRYRGRIDDNWENESAVATKDFRNALKALQEGKEVPVPEARAIGCSVKWK